MSAFPRNSVPRDWNEFGRAYVAFGADLWRASWQVGSGYVQRAAEEVVRFGLDPQPRGRLLRRVLNGLVNFSGEMLTLYPVALDRFSRRLDGCDGADIPDPSRPASGPPPAPRIHVVDGIPVVLPVRIIDASQGWAIYFVSARRAARHLAAITDKFTIVDLGTGRTPVSILGCDYRKTDLGKYSEIGIGFFVRPKDDPSQAPGTLFLSLSVNDRFNLVRASALWGYSKTLALDLEVTYQRDTTRFVLNRADPDALSISYPRFGEGRATEIPIYTYGLGSDAQGRRTIPLKTLISRNASGQGTQIGGNVSLTLGDRGRNRCVCHLWSDGEQACVCDILRDLGLPRQPAANGWLEHMSALCSEAVSCR